jgi:hypothetical protein
VQGALLYGVEAPVIVGGGRVQISKVLQVAIRDAGEAVLLAATAFATQEVQLWQAGARATLAMLPQATSSALQAVEIECECRIVRGVNEEGEEFELRLLV